MTTRRYTRAPVRSDTVERVLAAAETAVHEGRFHTLTMEDIAREAGVARATLFSRFGSRLGVLEALNTRCGDSPEIHELRAALDVEDPMRSLETLVRASCRVWERWGGIQRHLRAVVVLEPEVRPLIETQRTFQRRSLESLALRLDEVGALREPDPGRAAAMLHLLTSLEAFIELREESGLSLDETIAAVWTLVGGVVAVDPDQD
ncbi:Bacterial regulatory proteins, tetR family [Nocardia otitidiscaviarum]|uniref:Bacterial regulatory proteins, tetR family n=1 Tax=Nocardia otitidiscaviarum TaxID=1823 RepID=A0A378YND7_9NOCA|nr:TetR/AcrR family transcriptional regulator [Nocardia otitidiscaviarum]SUA78080.1 Bacterial regulatory proteins, tetR family [Nocardia otitidiscaviarum]